MNEIVFAVLISILVFLLIFILSILSRRKVKPQRNSTILKWRKNGIT